jgi:hypothetical protein
MVKEQRCRDVDIAPPCRRIDGCSTQWELLDPRHTRRQAAPEPPRSPAPACLPFGSWDVIGERLHDDSGAVTGTQGFYIDATPRDYGREQSISDRVAEINDNRAVIEQTKGALIFIYGVNAEAAFDLIKRRSQETNVKLRPVAKQILEDIRVLYNQTNGAPSRQDFDRILLSAHLRAGRDTP